MKTAEINNAGKPVFIPCFLCGNGLEVKSSKRNKPYLICDWCGVQTFIRGQGGSNPWGNILIHYRRELL
jgi:hypothetical protein